MSDDFGGLAFLDASRIITVCVFIERLTRPPLERVAASVSGKESFRRCHDCGCRLNYMNQTAYCSPCRERLQGNDWRHLQAQIAADPKLA